MKTFRTLLALLGAVCCMQTAVAATDDAPASPQDSPVQRAYDMAMKTAQPGPGAVKLGDQAVLNLPAGYDYIPQLQGKQLMEAMGNQVGSNFYGLILSEKLNGFVTIDFDPAGYIKDDEAKDWDASELLKNLKEGTEAGNEERRKRGITEFEVVGWIEKPAYDTTNRRLVWSAALQDKGAAPTAEQGVNYNTYLLGREGYLEMNLVTDKSHIDAEKPLAKELLAAVSFNDGKRYQDFNSSTDKVAEYGLAALVGGIAAKKLGLLAMLGVLIAKGGKLALIALIGLGAGVRKFLGRKKQNEFDTTKS